MKYTRITAAAVPTGFNPVDLGVLCVSVLNQEVQRAGSGDRSAA